MKLYLIRHALPEPGTYDNRYPGPGLGATGKQQAYRIGQFLAEKPLKALWSSDFTRTLETALAVQEFHPHLVIQKDHRLRERQADAESHESLVSRVWQWCDEAIPPFINKSMAIVAHGGSLNMILEYFDPAHTLLEYPWLDSYGVRTPIAGIWELIIDSTYKPSGKLIQYPQTL